MRESRYLSENWSHKIKLYTLASTQLDSVNTANNRKLSLILIEFNKYNEQRRELVSGMKDEKLNIMLNIC